MTDKKLKKKELAAVIERLTNQFADLNSRLNRISFDKTKQGSQLDQLREDNTFLAQRLGGMEERVIQLTSTDAGLSERWQALQRQTSELISTIESLPDQQDVQETLKSLTGQLEPLQGEQKDLKSALETTRNSLNLLSNETGDLKRDTADLTAHIRSLEESGSELSVRDSLHESQILALQGTVAELIQKLGEIPKEEPNDLANQQSLLEITEPLRNQLEQLRLQLSERNGQNKEMERRLLELANRIGESEARVLRIGSRIDGQQEKGERLEEVLERRISGLESLADSIKPTTEDDEDVTAAVHARIKQIELETARLMDETDSLQDSYRLLGERELDIAARMDAFDSGLQRQSDHSDSLRGQITRLSETLLHSNFDLEERLKATEHLLAQDFDKENNQAERSQIFSATVEEQKQQFDEATTQLRSEIGLLQSGLETLGKESHEISQHLNELDDVQHQQTLHAKALNEEVLSEKDKIKRTSADLNVRLTGAESLLTQQRNDANDQAKQIDELADRIGEQSRRAEVFKHLTASLQNDTSGLKESDTALALRLDEAERGIKSSADAQGLLSQQLTLLEQRLAELSDQGDAGMASLGSRLTGLTTQMVTQIGVGEGLTQRLDGLEPSVEGQLRSLENLHSEQERLAQAGTQYHERLTQQENKGNAIGEELAELQSGHQQLTEKSNRQATALEAIADENSKQQVDFENLAQEVKTLGGGVESVMTRGSHLTWAILGLFGFTLLAGFLAYKFISERIAGTERELAEKLLRQGDIHILSSQFQETLEQTRSEVDHLKEAVVGFETVRDSQRVDEHFDLMELAFSSLKDQLGQGLERVESQSLESASRQDDLSAEVDGLAASLAEIKLQFYAMTLPEPEQRWWDLRDAGGYSIQLIGASSKEAIQSFARNHKLEGERAYVQAELDGRDWYVFLYGMYGGFSEATEALEALPESLRRYQPWIRSVPTEGDLTPF